MYGTPGVQDGCVLTIPRLEAFPGRLGVATFALILDYLTCGVTSHRRSYYVKEVKSSTP